MPEPLSDLFLDHTVRTVALGAATLGIVAGALGTFAVLRRQSLLGDALSHAALPGIALAFLLTGSKAPLWLLVGAVLGGWIATLAVLAIVRASRVKYDSALGIVLSVFFGFGLVLLTFIQRRPDASQAGLDKFLFGQAASVLRRDVVTMAAIGAVALLGVLVLWKEFKLLSFDPAFGASLGFSVRALDLLLTALLVVAIAVGLQTVGVVLMSALVVAPAAAARQWTDRLGTMVVVSALFGALAGVGGAAVTSATPRLPTGPVIVLCLTAIVTVSLLAAPRRGLVRRWVEDLRTRRRLRTDAVLADLYSLARQHDTPEHGHPVAVLNVMERRVGVERSLQELAARGWARRSGDDEWALTAVGRAEAERRSRERS